MTLINKSRRSLPALVLILAVGLSACSAAAPTNPPAAETAAPQAAPAQTTQPAVEAPAPTQPPAAGAIHVFDSRGKEIILAQPAARIISLAPSNTEILFALGGGDRLVGRDSFSDYPEEAKAVTDIGGGFSELNMEVILAQTPDLVLASSLNNEAEIKALEDAGLAVFTLANPTNFDGLYANLRTAAQLIAAESAAEPLIADLQARVAAVQEKLAGVTDRPLVFYEIDGTDPNAIWTPGPGSFVDMLITMAGGENLGADLKDEWAQVNLEALIARQPEIILLGDAYWGGVTVEAASSRSGWEALEAVKAGKIYPFDDNLVSRPGPRLVQGLEALAKLLHPDLF